MQEQLRSLGVQALYLFGSRAQGTQGPLSDFDFAVLMDDAHQRGDATYDRLYDLLTPLCHRTLENDVIDIVFLRNAPLELRFHVIRYGTLLYDGVPKKRAHFEEETVLAYCDYRPLLDMFDRAILTRI